MVFVSSAGVTLFSLGGDSQVPFPTKSPFNLAIVGTGTVTPAKEVSAGILTGKYFQLKKCHYNSFF